jgi:hypothetical protein
MKHRSTNSRYNVAASKIRSQFIRSLGSSSGKPVKLINTRDASTPSLSFTFIDDYVYREGVEPPDPAVMEGCGLVRSKYSNQTCRPNMGGNCGCEYTQSCECLEYARVNEKKLDEEQMAQWQNHWQDHEQGVAIDLMGLPKRFPYSKETGLLVMDYLSQRWTIYECNDNCACGPICKSRVVQRGRTVGLEIFRTKNRGWGTLSASHVILIACSSLLQDYAQQNVSHEANSLTHTAERLSRVKKQIIVRKPAEKARTATYSRLTRVYPMASTCTRLMVNSLAGHHASSTIPAILIVSCTSCPRIKTTPSCTRLHSLQSVTSRPGKS